MFKVTKEEAMAIRERYPDVHVTITSKHTSHKKYYAPEERKVFYFLERFRAKQQKKFTKKEGT